MRTNAFVTTAFSLAAVCVLTLAASPAAAQGDAATGASAVAQDAEARSAAGEQESATAEAARSETRSDAGAQEDAAAVAARAEHAQRMAKEHQHDTATASPATTPEPAQPVTAEEVNYATLDGVAVKGYLAQPAQKSADGKPLPALIVIQEWWGLNDQIRVMARRFAGEGYLVLAVDLYEGKLATTPEEAMAAMQAAMQNSPRLMSNLRQAHGYLSTQGKATEIGVVGWCFGGGWALETALQIPDGIDAAVMYYGRTQTDPKALAALEAPLLGLFGGKDEGIPVDGVRQMEHELVTQGKNVRIVIYPEADHAFANPTGNSYLAGPATDAWAKTVAFFAQHLKN